MFATPFTPLPNDVIRSAPRLTLGHRFWKTCLKARFSMLATAQSPAAPTMRTDEFAKAAQMNSIVVMRTGLDNILADVSVWPVKYVPVAQSVRAADGSLFCLIRLHAM